MVEPQSLLERIGEEIDRVRMACMFAAGAHAAVGQVRKYTGEPYIVHPEEVAAIVKTVPHTPDMLCAAYLHDVVEDTGVTLADVRQHFGPVVESYVNGLTHRSKPEDGNRFERKEIDREFLAQQCREVQTIKLADLISNMSSIARHDPEFAKVYLREKKALLFSLNKGDETLNKLAWESLRAGLKQLEQ